MVCHGREFPVRAAKLLFLDHLHGLDAGEKNARAVKSVEAEHGSHNRFDGSMVLLDDIVEVLDLTQFDVGAGVGLNALDGCSVGTALVNGNFLRQAMQPDGALQEASSCSLSFSMLRQ